MINQERVSRMTRLSIMESGTSGRLLDVAARRKTEYTVIHTMLSVISGTLCFGCGLVLWSGVNWDRINALTARTGVRGMLALILAAYGVFLALYLLLSWRVLRRRYQSSRELKRKYLKEADALSASYSEEVRENGSVTQDKGTNSDIYKPS